MIIEFAGLPGTGKSTIAEMLGKRGWEIVQAKNRKELLWYNLLFLTRHPLRFFVLLRTVIRNARSFSEFYLLFMNSFLHVNAKHMKARTHTKAIVDQGYIQNIFSVFSHELSAKEVERYVCWALESDHLFLFTASEEVRKQRMKKRGYGVREWMDTDKREAWMNAAESNTKTLVEYLEEHNIDWSQVDAEQKEDEVLKDLNDTLSRKEA